MKKTIIAAAILLATVFVHAQINQKNMQPEKGQLLQIHKKIYTAIALPLFATSEENIIIIDNTAILTALAHINIKRGDQPVQELWERVTETYIKQLGQWKLLAIQATFVQKN